MHITDIMYVGEPEHIRTVIVGQFTKKNWQNDKVDKCKNPQKTDI